MRDLATSGIRLGLTVLLGATLAAQEPAFGGGWAAKMKHFDVEPSLHYLATRAGTSDAPASINEAAWLMMAFLADGSTMRTGLHKSTVKNLAKWLREQQDENGHFAIEGKPCTRLEQLLATNAMTWCCIVSNYTLLVPTAHKSYSGCESAITGDGAAPLTADEFALLTIVAKEVEDLGKQRGAPERARDLAVAARKALKPGADRRTDAALHLGALMLGEEHPPELTVARTWPANPTADPLMTYFGIYALALAGPQTLRAELQPLEKLVAVRTTDGEDAGSWPAAGGFDQPTTTAILATVLGIANTQLRR